MTVRFEKLSRKKKKPRKERCSGEFMEEEKVIYG